MTSLVLVSHSRALAKAAAELAKKVNAEDTLPVAFAGGTGDNYELLGTDAMDICDAIRSVYSDDGVLVLMDMGSAVISARLALDFLDDCPRVQLSSAPLVEGAVVAAVQMKAGSSLEAIAEEVLSSLAAKEQSTGGVSKPVSESALAVPENALKFRFRIGIEHGLHARPAAQLVGCAAKFKSSVFIADITKNKAPVNAKSMNKLSLYNVSCNDEVEILVFGEDEQLALDGIKKMVEENFEPLYAGSEPAPLPAPLPAKPAKLRCLSSGIAIGTVFQADVSYKEEPALPIDDPVKETGRLEAALAQAEIRIKEFRENLEKMGHADEAAIFEAHLMILYDDELLTEVKKTITATKICAEHVYMNKMAAAAEGLKNLPDDYMKQRAADIMDVAKQVQAALSGASAGNAGMNDVILLAKEISPAMLGKWGEKLKGVVSQEGGATSHAAIIARALGIPCLCGYEIPALDKTGSMAAVDADNLLVKIDASEEDINNFREKQAAWKALLAEDDKHRQGDALTKDGVRIEVLANAGDAEGAAAALERGAAGIGLLRTEFLFLSKRQAPTEDEQTDVLKKIFSACGNRPVTVRTLDIGGDKFCSWLNIEKENNPFLGVRGIRLCLKEKDFFKSQIRSILRAGYGCKAKIMIPMVSVLEEILFAKEIVNAAHQELAEENTPHLWPIDFGIMMETPAAALMAHEFAGYVDFFSIGTNDLGQYVMCAERGGSFEYDLLDDFQPAKLRAVKLIAEAAEQKGIRLSVCGEMAGSEKGALALLGLGVRTLSLSSGAAGRIKKTIRQSDCGELAKTMDKALEKTSFYTIRDIF